jgi:hypothetical protein
MTRLFSVAGQLTVWTEMAVDECGYRRGQGITGEVDASANFARDIFRDIFGPMLQRVECDDADRVAVLAGHQIANRRFEVGLVDVGLAIGSQNRRRRYRRSDRCRSAQSTGSSRYGAYATPNNATPRI